MKKLLTALSIYFFSIGAWAQTKDVMIIEKNDGMKVQYDVEALNQIYFDKRGQSVSYDLAVDLGLSVKWASLNVGASSIEDIGDEYAWGEIEPRTTYGPENYQYYDITWGEYIDIGEDISGTEYDAAHVKWGGDWRMPTKKEMEELLTRCTWSVIKYNGTTTGCKVTGPNGNKIFLPVYDESGTRSDGFAYTHECMLWTSTRKNDSEAYNCYSCLSDGDIVKFIGYSNKCKAQSQHQRIRPVCPLGQDDDPFVLTITTGDVTNIRETTATLSGHIDGISSPVTAGFIYGKTNELSEINGIKLTTTATENYNINVTGLSSNTTYYYRSFAEVNGRYYLGDIRNFTTSYIALETGSSVTNIKETSATVTGQVTTKNFTADYTIGFFLSLSGKPSKDNNIKNISVGKNKSGQITCNITGLEGSTTYRYRIYLLCEGVYYYASSDNSFTTKPKTTGKLNGHEWVDLGLPSGLKWATCNVGASSPSGYGNYYAWGETYSKSSYGFDYSYYGSTSIPSNISGTSYDVAYTSWGSTWRMPTITEIRELKNNCSFQWTSVGGVYGAKLTGPNGNYIFLPAAGGIGAGFTNGASSYSFRGERGFYWSSTIHTRQNGNDAKSLYFTSDGIRLTTSDIFGNYSDMNHQCFNGLTVRPVTN